jgi:hypothetical protein
VTEIGDLAWKNGMNGTDPDMAGRKAWLSEKGIAVEGL